jgi:predicted nucleic acid-binding Zn ribbon protein
MANIGLSDWRRAVGARLSERAQPERIADGVLTVRVPSSTWAQELSMLSQTVVERLREAGHPIERLRFNVAPTANAAATPVHRVEKSALPASLERSIASIEDAELRLALGDAAAYSLGRKG